MNAADTVSPIRPDRYLALLAVLLAIVLGLLVLSERQRLVMQAGIATGELPPLPDPRFAAIAAERDALLVQRDRLAQALATAERELLAAETRAQELALENRRLGERLDSATQKATELAQELVTAQAEYDRLADEASTLMTQQRRLEARLAVLSAMAEPTAAPEPEQPEQPEPEADLLQLVTPEQDGDAERWRQVDGNGSYPPQQAPEQAPATDVSTDQPPRRLITFDGHGGRVADGVAAYREGDYAAAARIWGALAASGNPRAQFHFGSLLFEGRLNPPDRVMAYVWLSRAVDGGHLPAIEVRRQVRAAMSEEEYARALAIEERRH